MAATEFSNDDPLRGQVTRLLNEIRLGNRSAEEELFPMVYHELHRLAAAFMRTERPNHTLQPTALVHEAYLRLLSHNMPEWQNRAHFLSVAARAMRRVLVDHARQRKANKRGGDAIKVDLTGIAIGATGADNDEMIALEEALTKLEQRDMRQCRVVELRFFAGLTDEEAAVILGVSSRSVKRDWHTAKAWLYGEMTRR